MLFQNCDGGAVPSGIISQLSTPVILKDQWSAFASDSRAPARYYHTGVSTGSRLITFGGFYYDGATAYIQNNGKIYDPSLNAWIDINVTGGPGPRANHSAVWTGSKMIIWGGRTDASTAASNTGMIYDPATNLWSPMSSAGAPSARYGHSAVWTGSKMIVFGGYNGTNYFFDGAIYDLASNTWSPLNINGGPTFRAFHAAVWTGHKMIIWGGATVSGYLADGKAYDAAANTWSDISSNGAPSARGYLPAVWTGSQMILFGGYFNNGGNVNYNTGAVYSPASDSWTQMSTTNAPVARYGMAAGWINGLGAIFLGGIASTTVSTVYNDGGIYN